MAPHHAHRRGAQGLPAADGKRRGAYDEAPDTEPEEAANGAESTDEPDGEDNGQGEARQTSDPSPLDQFTRPCRRNVNDASNFARLIKYFSGDLVIALPDPSDSKPAVGRGRSKALPDIYAIDSRGMLSSARAGSLLLKIGRLYYAECYGLEGAERHACADDARKLGNDGVLERLCGVAEAAVHDLRDAGALPRGLVVKCKSEIDCHLNYIGTPKGVLDLRTGHIVPPAEGPARIHRIPIYYVALTYVALTGLKGQTLGKMALGIIVVNAQGEAPGIRRAAFREIVGKLASEIAIFLGYLWVGWDEKKRGWHDHIAKTYVVRAPGRRERPAKRH